MTSGKRLFLSVGDSVIHLHYEQWGRGCVVEELTSTLPGGTCLVRIQFADGRQRTFNNDLDSELCCYYFGIRKEWRPAATFDPEAAAPRRRPVSRRRLPPLA